jgi:hypothetical protein
MNKPNSSLSQFIEEYPLYSKFGTDQPIEAADLNNLVFNFFCKVENEIQPFRLGTTFHNNVDHPAPVRPIHQAIAEETDFTEMFTGICQSCEKFKMNIIICGESQHEKPRYFIRKIGQYPAPESPMVKLPSDILGLLDEDSRESYRRAMKNLEWGYGAGALTYFSKMMKQQIGRIIEALSNLYFPGGNKIADAFMAYNEKKQKTKFIEEITPHLPETLKQHGANILMVLNDAASMNIQDLAEQDCMKRARDIDTLFRYLARRISAEISDETTKKADKYFLRYS